MSDQNTSGNASVSLNNKNNSVTNKSSHKDIILTSAAPLPIGTYSQAVKCGNTIYFSGQIPLDPATKNLVGSDVATQLTQVFKNLTAVANAAGGDLNNMAKLTIYLTDLSEFPVVNEIMSKFFQEPFPARTTIGISALPAGAKVEVEGIMAL